MQTIFEVTDDDGSVSYLHMGDAPDNEHHEDNRNQFGGNQFGRIDETFGQAYFKQNKAISWSQNELRPADLFPLFNRPNQPISSMFKSAE